jgi:hypothetical protein
LKFSHCIFEFFNTLLHARIFLAFLCYYKNPKNISEHENLLENYLNIFSKQVLAEHPRMGEYSRSGAGEPQKSTRRATQGSA